MNFNKNIIIIFLIITLGFFILIIRGVFLQIVLNKNYYTKIYEDKKIIQYIENSIKNKDISIINNKIVLKNKILYRNKFMYCIKKGLIFIDDNKITFDKNSFKIYNPRLRFANKYIKRGRILDRNGVVLSDSIMTQNGYKRVYYDFYEMFPVVGYWGEKLCGVEYYMNNYLSGISKLKLWEPLSPIFINQKSGEDIILTIDKDLQKYSAKEMLGKKGAIVIMNPDNGEILTLFSSPSISDIELEKNWKNKATDENYSPGSSFKIIISSIALDNGIINKDENFLCTGRYKPFPKSSYAIHDFEYGKYGYFSGHNPLGNKRFTIMEAFEKSCNVTFSQIGVRIGSERLFAEAGEFGFYKNINLIPQIGDNGWLVVKSRLYPNIDSPKEIPKEMFTKTHLAQSGIGQYEVKVTPLQMALVGCAIVNNGMILQPTIVKSNTPRGVLFNPISPQTAKYVEKMMINVVEKGTGRAAKVPGVIVGGKTGTAQVEGKSPHSWFVCFAKYSNPTSNLDEEKSIKESKIVIVVFVENGGTGGSVSAPIAGKIIKFWKDKIVK